MKLFWKIFISIVILSVTFFIIGSQLLIHSSFAYSMQAEIQNTKNENHSLQSNIKGNLKRLMKTSSITSINQLLENNSLWNTSKRKSPKIFIPIRVSDVSYQTVYENGWIDIETSLWKNLEIGTLQDELVKLEGDTYIHVISSIYLLDNLFYIENYRNISLLIENSVWQYKVCILLLFIMLLFGSIIAFFISKRLTRPIHLLSDATKKIALGDYSERVPLCSSDELRSLSMDFNKMTEQLQQNVKELKDAAHRQENFVANFAHELKTPLTSIIGYADMLRSKKMDSEQIIFCASYIFEEGKRLESLSMKLMELIILKHQSITLKSVYTEPFFHHIETVIRPILEEEQIIFYVSYQNAVIEIEPDLMKSICINLLDNARKAVNKQGEISLIGKKEDNTYCISISDNGIGIKQSELSRITEPFYMADKSRSRAKGGAGLGLSICEQIVKLHNAAMTIDSEPHVGTCITIRLKCSS